MRRPYGGGRHARECNRVHVTMILCTGIKAIDLGVAEPRKVSELRWRAFSGSYYRQKKEEKDNNNGEFDPGSG